MHINCPLLWQSCTVLHATNCHRVYIRVGLPSVPHLILPSPLPTTYYHPAYMQWNIASGIYDGEYSRKCHNLSCILSIAENEWEYNCPGKKLSAPGKNACKLVHMCNLYIKADDEREWVCMCVCQHRREKERQWIDNVLPCKECRNSFQYSFIDSRGARVNCIMSQELI